MLGPENRSLVVMHLVEGYTLAELEEFFNVSAETLKTRLRRSKARLKKFLLI
jgi:RNA polymerase sigma-70 factor (ECF subfamily)